MRNITERDLETEKKRLEQRLTESLNAQERASLEGSLLTIKKLLARLEIRKTPDVPKWEDYGESSLTLLAVHCGMTKDEPNIPLDPSDFKRCIHLFDCLGFGQGEIFSLLCKTADKHPEWKVFAENWDALMELWNEEKQQKVAPKLFALIERLRKR